MIIMWDFIETVGDYDFYRHKTARTYNCCKHGEVFDQRNVSGYYELNALKKFKGVKLRGTK